MITLLYQYFTLVLYDECITSCHVFIFALNNTTIPHSVISCNTILYRIVTRYLFPFRFSIFFFCRSSPPLHFSPSIFPFFPFFFSPVLKSISVPLSVPFFFLRVCWSLADCPTSIASPSLLHPVLPLLPPHTDSTCVTHRSAAFFFFSWWIQTSLRPS